MNELDEWHKEDAWDEYIACCCANVDILVEHTPRSWMCRCGWSGTPDRTHNSGGATNYRYCPRCKDQDIRLVDNDE